MLDWFKVEIGVIHKGRPHWGGGGVGQKRTGADGGGEGGSKAKADVRFFLQYFQLFVSDFIVQSQKDLLKAPASGGCAPRPLQNTIFGILNAEFLRI